MIDIIVVNINNLLYTKNLISDLLRQTKSYDLKLVDQGSTEGGTKEYFYSLDKYKNIRLLMNNENIPLSKLWNDFYLESKSDYLCFLNNDTRIASNFVEQTIEVLNKEKKVGCVVHATNHPEYRDVKPLDYVIMKDLFVQGWDFTLRKEAYSIIPEELRFYGGDDYLYVKLRENDWEIVMLLSSPVIHYKRKSRQYFPGNEEELARVKKYRRRRVPYTCRYSNNFPTYRNIYE